MLDPNQVSAVLVIRGDVDLTEILASLAPLAEVIIWNNALEDTDLAVYGRYHAIEQARCPVIYVQDDDCVLAPGALDELLAAYEPGLCVCNMPERFRVHYPDSGLVGFGALFDRELPDIAFNRFAFHRHASWGIATSPEFDRRADNVFTTLTQLKLVDLPYRDLPWASHENRMWKQPGHIEERDRMIELARQVRDQVPA